MSEKKSNKTLNSSLLLKASNIEHNFDYPLFKNINLDIKEDFEDFLK